MDEKSAEQILVEHMVSTQGWNDIIKKWILAKIDDAKNRLTTVKPTDAIKITEYQSVIKNYTVLLAHIDNYVKKK